MTPSLTPRESQVAALVRDGWLAREIADALGVSLATVRFHIANIARKLPTHRGGPRFRILAGPITSNGARTATARED